MPGELGEPPPGLLGLGDKLAGFVGCLLVVHAGHPLMAHDRAAALAGTVRHSIDI
jgi:hypothetical protein